MKKKIGIAASILLCMILTACSGSQKANENQDKNAGAETAPSVVIESSSLEESPEVEELMRIETEYGTLLYPSECKDSLVTDEINEDGILSVTFSARAEEQEYALFKVMICSEEGDSVGILTDESGTVRNVFVDINELTGISDLGQDVQNQLYAMQEGVNVLIENLQ